MSRLQEALAERGLDLYITTVCLEAFEAAVDKARPGATCADVHNAAQATIDSAGYTEGFRKRAGYSMGVSFAPDWGEGYIMSVHSCVDIELVPGMAFHLPITLREYLRAHRRGQRDHSDHGGGMPELELAAERSRQSLNNRHDPAPHRTFEPRAGDGLMFHGRRVLCGRAAYMPEEPARYVLTGSVDFDEFRSALRLSTEPGIGAVPLPRTRPGMVG